jgi:hypothetical protein
MKLFEVRDRGTLMPVFAFRPRSVPFNEAESWLLARAGFGSCNDSECVVVGCLEVGGAEYDAFAWPGRTMKTAHLHIEKHFDQLHTGEVIDVEFILGETPAPKVSERLTWLDHP